MENYALLGILYYVKENTPRLCCKPFSVVPDITNRYFRKTSFSSHLYGGWTCSINIHHVGTLTSNILTVTTYKIH